MRSGVLVYGAGGHGKVVLDAALTAGLTVSCVLDDAPDVDSLLGLPVVRAETYDWQVARGSGFIIGVGDNGARARLYERSLERGLHPTTVCHPGSSIAHRVKIGQGTFVAAGVVVIVGAVIGNNVIINTAASIDHDCCVGDHTHICPGVRLAGEVVVGSSTMIGTGAVVLPGTRIGSYCVIGAGAVVHRDIPDYSVAMGVPARVVRRIEVS